MTFQEFKASVAHFFSTTDWEWFASPTFYSAKSCRDEAFVEYEISGCWRYHFNGISGEGTALSEAIGNHESKYSEFLTRQEF